VTGFADYDAKLIRLMKLWVYKPFLVDDQPVAVCSYVRYRYSQK
jgi:hypothetical protein